MSTRNIRKIFNVVKLPPLEGNSDEEFEPKYVKATSAFQGLVLSSSDSDQNCVEVDDDNDPEEVVYKKKNKTKKKNKSRKKKGPEPCVADKELDEIDKSVLEVNALLGAPPPACEVRAKSVDTIADLLSVQYKYLSYEAELRRKIGPDGMDDGSSNKKLDREAQLRLENRGIIIPSKQKYVQALPKGGLSMSVQRRDEDATYFTFDHSKEYQRKHKYLLAMVRTGYSYADHNLQEKIEYGLRFMHIEVLLECIDKLFQMDENTNSSDLLEQVIAYMQLHAHPSFNVTFKKTRLEYKYIENRPFHIALLKYMHLLSNMACHRTALELAKLLLNLDPSDPLAVLFVIDTIALRAREHKWLIDVVDAYFEPKKDAKFMFNIQYSYAMAHFHVAKKAKADTIKADELIQKAIMRFPLVVLKLLDGASVKPSERVQGHPVFQRAPKETTKDLSALIRLYAALAVPRWREPAVWTWLLKNVDAVMDRYDADKDIQASVDHYYTEQGNLFRSWPDEIVRHLSVIAPMSNLLVDGAVPGVDRAPSANPAPPQNGINRYGYDDVNTRNSDHTVSSLMYDLFSSLVPLYGVEMPEPRPPDQE